jgi:hypothetical protein
VTRGVWLRVTTGVLLLALAVTLAFVSHGVAEAQTAFRQLQEDWQRGLAEEPATSPGSAQRVGESLLGIRTRSELLREYQAYRAGMADVVPGTEYPQTRARFKAITRLRDLRSLLSSNEDRASADVVLGVLLASGISTPGEQRAVQTRDAIDSFTRAVLEDPTNATAKLDLEVELRSELDRTKAGALARASGSPSRRRQRQQDPRGPTTPTRVEGTGY